MSFFNDVANFAKRAVTPPKSKANIIKAVAAPFTFGTSLAIPSDPLGFVKKTLRYTGAAATNAFLPASVRKQAFGLSDSESSAFEVGAKVERGVLAAVAAFVGGSYITGSAPGLFAAKAGAPAVVNSGWKFFEHPAQRVAADSYASDLAAGAKPFTLVDAGRGVAVGASNQGGFLSAISGGVSKLFTTTAELAGLKLLSGPGGGQGPSFGAGGTDVSVGSPGPALAGSPADTPSQGPSQNPGADGLSQAAITGGMGVGNVAVLAGVAVLAYLILGRHK